MHPTITVGIQAIEHSEGMIIIGCNAVISSPSAELLESCPDYFNCFSCLEKKPRNSLGGRTGGEWLCKTCFPYVDQHTVDGIRQFDSRLVTHLAQARKSSKKPPIINEDWRNIAGEFYDAFTGEPIKLSERKAQDIEDFRKAYRHWRLARRMGFPGFKPPKDDKLKQEIEAK
jgi:hypothetical protein